VPDQTESLVVLLEPDRSSPATLLQGIRRSKGPLLLVLPPDGLESFSEDNKHRFFREAKALNSDRRLILATKEKNSRFTAQVYGWEVIGSLKKLRALLGDHAVSTDAQRVFSPVSWRQGIRTKLQSVGLLAVPRSRIWALFICSLVAFLYVFFRLLPSAEVRIWPSQEAENFTTNIYLHGSGAVLPVPGERVRTLPLIRLTVRLHKSMTYDQISKNFTGTNARMYVVVFNDADEQYSLRKNTRIINQAGMRFRIQDDLILAPHSKQEVLAIADPIDQYGEVLGERGNVPANVKWDFPGLSERERTFVYARNEKSASGGTTSYETILTKEDIEGSKVRAGARQRLEQELLIIAKEQVDEEMKSRNQLNGTHFTQLRYDELTKIVYKDFALSEVFVGQSVSTIPLEGSIDYTVILYDESAVLNLLKDEVLLRVPNGREVVASSLSLENMNIHVIAPWDDDLNWVKVTADLTYEQRYVLDPITPSGAKFAKQIRDSVIGKTVSEAYRILKNLPEVSRVEIHVWPPWAFTLPDIGTNIAITQMY
jgi:hypothetical protein